MEESLRMYESAGDMVESMPCKLEWKSFTGVSGHCFTVVWSKNDDELKRPLPDSSISKSLKLYTLSGYKQRRTATGSMTDLEHNSPLFLGRVEH